MSLTRRRFVAQATLGSTAMLFVRQHGRAAFAEAPASPDVVVQQRSRAEHSFTQFHNQTSASSLHRRIVDMWAAINKETGGRVEARVFPQNNQIPGSDPAALKMLVAGEIQFFTLMGGILGTVVPVAEVQQVPFSFQSAAQAHRAMDGPLGAYLREEMAAKGIVGFAVGAFDNGMRQIAGLKRPIVVPADLVGIRMRVPAGQMVADAFRTLGAEPVIINSDSIYEALKSGRVDAQENPLALVDLFKIYEVVKYVSMTNHMWSGFNMLANLAVWKALPAEFRTIIERNVATAVRLQRRDQQEMNTSIRASLVQRGLVFNEVEAGPFRKQLSDFYARWKEQLGTKCWGLLEESTKV